MSDLHPSGSILAINSALRVVLLPQNQRVPITYTLTVGTAPGAGATSLNISSIAPAPTTAHPLVIEDGTVLSFGTGRNVVARSAVAGQFFQEFTSGGPTTLTTEPMSAVAGERPAAGGTATTQGLFDLLGIQGLDQSNSTNLISIRSQKSGLGNEQRATMVSYEISVSGWLHQRDVGFNRAIRPANNDSREIWIEARFNDGRILRSPAGVSNLQYQNQLDDVIKVSYTIFVQGIPTELFA